MAGPSSSSSSSPDLPDATPGTSHAYIADLQTGQLTIADTTADGHAWRRHRLRVDVSADGDRVAFVGYAGNLGGSTKGPASVYVKDLRDGSLTWASRPEDGNPDHTDRRRPVAQRGWRVMWPSSSATRDFGFGANGDAARLPARPWQRSHRVGVRRDAGRAGRRAAAPVAQRGRQPVTFAESSFGGNPTRTYLPRPRGRRDHPAGNRLPRLDAANLDPTGTCAAFRSSSPNLSDPGYPSPDFDHVYVRAIGGDCPHVATGPGAGPGGGGGSGTADATAPVISGLHVTHKSFRLATKRTALTAKRHKRGTTFVFKLSERARVTISIAKGSRHRVTLTRSHSQARDQQRRVQRANEARPTPPRPLSRHGASNGRRGQPLEGKDGDLHRGATLNSTVRAAGSARSSRTVTSLPGSGDSPSAGRGPPGRASCDQAVVDDDRRRTSRRRGPAAAPPRRGRRRRARRRARGGRPSPSPPAAPRARRGPSPAAPSRRTRRGSTPRRSGPAAGAAARSRGRTTRRSAKCSGSAGGSPSNAV